MMQKNTKTVCITGATSGIGRACALQFARNNWSLVLLARRAKKLEELTHFIQNNYDVEIKIFAVDVRDFDGMKKVLSNYLETSPQIDLLINNAGLALGLSSIDEGSLDHWNQMIDTNIKGILHVTKLFLPGMKKHKMGQIINISSIAGKEVYPNGNVYCATKHAVEALTKSMRIDLLKHNIRVSQVAPGHVENTNFALVRFEGDTERAKIYEDFNPVRSEDIARIIYFIASQPAHVNINDLVVMGTQQANATILNRSGRIFDK